MQERSRLSVSPRAIELLYENPAQLKALWELTTPGQWDTAAGANVFADFDTVMFCPTDRHGVTLMQLGIEKDGYTHS